MINRPPSRGVDGVTTNMRYDAWGRLTRRTQGAYQADYAYHYGGKLVEAVSDFPGEGTVAYNYGGDQKRRERAVTGGDTTWYRWDLGWGLLNEEDDSGNLERTCIPGLAQIDGDDAATGDYAFYMQDHLGSTRGLYDSAKAPIGDYQFSPYGHVYAAGAFGAATQQYTGHHWDAASALYFAPYRYDSPTMARWLSRDPLGMVDGPNVYAYVAGSPISWADPTGLTILEIPVPEQPGGGGDDGYGWCRYYDIKCRQRGCNYYCNFARVWCRRFPPSGSQNPWTTCTRKCLVDCDVECPKNSRGCPSFGSAQKCHVKCYARCGAQQIPGSLIILRGPIRDRYR